MKSLNTSLEKLGFRPTVIDRLKKLNVRTVKEFLARNRMELVEDGIPPGVLGFIRKKLLALGFITKPVDEKPLPDSTSDVSAFIRKNSGLLYDFLRQTSYQSIIDSGRIDAALEGQDLVQEVFIGFLRALRKFRPEKGTPFSTYAWFWFRQAASCLLLSSGTVKIPIRYRRLANAYKREKAALAISLGREPTAEEVCASLEIPMEKYDKFRVFLTVTNIHVESMEQSDSSTDDTRVLGDTLQVAQGYEALPSPERVLIARDAKAALSQIMEMAGLNPRSRGILIRRFGLDGKPGQKLEDVSATLGITKERVRQLEVQAKARLQAVSKHFQSE